jgi:dienelactone hydrolase
MKKLSFLIRMCFLVVVLLISVESSYAVSQKASKYEFKTAKLSKTTKHGTGTVYYPDDNQRHGVVLIMPGFMESQSFIQWYGPLLASNGFVTVTLDSKYKYDSPSARAVQLEEALKDTKLKFANIINPSLVAYMGHSMGGGALDAAVKDKTLKAIIPLAPYHGSPASTAKNNYTSIQVPTLIISCSEDEIASNARHSDVFYSAIPSNKMQITMVGGNHFCANTDESIPIIGTQLGSNDQYKPTITHFVLSWLKYYMNGQSDYLQNLCGPNAVQPQVQSSRNNWCK